MSQSNITANDVRDQAGLKMIIRYVFDAVLRVLFIKGICVNTVTIRVMLANSLIALVLSDTVVIFESTLNNWSAA